MKLAFLFPGQGAQKVGMGKALAERHPAARATFEEADRVLGYSLSRICWEGPEDELKQTRHTQPALLVHSVAALRLVEAAGWTPSWTAGHSLGEYTACVAAGAIDFRDALELVQRRGELMHQAGVDRPGTMAAILGMTPDQVEAVCAEAAAAGVVRPANLNAPGQIAISGEVAAVEKACELARAGGAKRAIRLEVGGAFHSPLMDSAAAGLAEKLRQVRFRDPRCPVVMNATAQLTRSAEQIRANLEKQLLGAVRWEESMRALIDQGVQGFVELGSGKVLRGLLRQIGAAAPSWNVEDPESLETTLSGLSATRLPAAEGA